jgi:protein-S-isoprenylcysteine O-methyltransferase Ste14
MKGGEEEMLAAPWYFRLFYVYLVSFSISFLLFFIIRAVRMQSTGQNRRGEVLYWLLFIVGIVLMWFNTFRINTAFWLGIIVLVFAQIVFGLGFAAMREHPEKKQEVVDWGIYGISRHSHVLAGVLTVLGIVIMAWNPRSLTYIALWIYFAAQLVLAHFGVLAEEKSNLQKFGKAYEEYMRKVPRYLWILK